jgi:hypothetical protein
MEQYTQSVCRLVRKLVNPELGRAVERCMDWIGGEGEERRFPIVFCTIDGAENRHFVYF